MSAHEYGDDALEPGGFFNANVMDAEADLPPSSYILRPPGEIVPKRGRGRPKGSKKKPRPLRRILKVSFDANGESPVVWLDDGSVLADVTMLAVEQEDFTRFTVKLSIAVERLAEGC
jgi:hypothetical protein